METTHEKTHPITDAIKSELDDLQTTVELARVRINLGRKDAQDGWDQLEKRIEQLSSALLRDGKQLKQETLSNARALRGDLKKFLSSY